jgi:hypothetical protein
MHATIQIASISAEVRHINVSGFTKARMRWLFRNFRLLDFSVLNEKQQQLIAQMWHTAPSAASSAAPLNLIGTLEGFSPQRYQPSVVATTESKPPRPRVALPSGLRIAPVLTAMAIVLLGSAIVVAAKHQWTPQIPVAAMAAAKDAVPNDAAPNDTASNNIGSTLTLPPLPSAESAPSVAGSPAPATAPSSVAPVHPDAMAESSAKVAGTSPNPHDAATTKAPGKPEVIIRVSVDSEGRATAFQILRGDQKKSSAALAAARHWSFQPCPASADCEHLLKFTDYGDASSIVPINN